MMDLDKFLSLSNLILFESYKAKITVALFLFDFL